MIFPLEELVKLKDPILEENDDKAVSLAARQLFTHEVQYRIEQNSRS